MTDIQWLFLGVGGSVIAGVLLYNWRQEKQFLRQTEQWQHSKQPDVLLGEAGEDAALEDEVAPVLRTRPQVSQHRLEHFLLPRVDMVVSFGLKKPVPAEDLRHALEYTGRMGKPVTWMGLNELTGWEPVDPNQHRAYVAFKMGLQMADRQGPADQKTLQQFLEAARFYADTWSAEVEWPDAATFMQEAQALDGFLAEVDVIIGLNVVSADGRPFTGTRIRSLCEANGLHLGDDGQFHRQSREGALFSVLSMDGEPMQMASLRDFNTIGLTLLFDVPRVIGGISVFERVATLAKHLAESVDGELVDDNRRPLNEQGLGSIKRQLTDIYNRMQLRGIEPGSPLALRLFA